MKSICLAVIILFVALAACEREGPAEKAGEAVDRAGRDIRDAVKGDK
jgi:predicted small lipoprotein YifL